MRAYDGRRVFRSPTWILATVTVAALLPAIGAWITFRGRGVSLLSLGLAAFAVLGVGGILETIAQRVELSNDALHITRWRVRRSYPRDSIVRVTSEKGVDPAMQLADGRWVKLPPVGAHMANSIRAWLRTSETARDEA
jgi:hypothetical protein